MKQKSEYRVGIGASSILMILVVLALTALALLSYNSARSTETLTQRNRAMTVAYYQATATAQRKLASMDQLLLLHRGEELDADGWQRIFTDQNLNEISVNDMDGVICFAFTIDAEYERELMVEGTLTPADETRYTLTRHEMVSQVSDATDSTLTLLR